MAFRNSTSCRKRASQLFSTIHPQEPKQEISPSDFTLGYPLLRQYLCTLSTQCNHCLPADELRVYLCQTGKYFDCNTGLWTKTPEECWHRINNTEKLAEVFSHLNVTSSYSGEQREGEFGQKSPGRGSVNASLGRTKWVPRLCSMTGWERVLQLPGSGQMHWGVSWMLAGLWNLSRLPPE